MPKLKRTEDGYPVEQDDKIVYIDDDGQEVKLDWQHAIGKIKSLSSDLDRIRSEKHELARKVEQYSDIEDPERAREALALMSNLDSKKLIDAGEVEKLKQEWGAHMQKELQEKDQAYKSKIGELEKGLQAKESDIHRLMVSDKFGQSKFVNSRLIPALRGRNAERIWAPHFSVVDGKLVATDHHGQKVFSKERHGELADFDEAIQQIVLGDPNKDEYLLPEGAGGTGAEESNGTGLNGGVYTISREKARDPHAYRAAKEAAAKQGVPFRVAEKGSAA